MQCSRVEMPRQGAEAVSLRSAKKFADDENNRALLFAIDYGAGIRKCMR
jgi:hypothetical protein